MPLSPRISQLFHRNWLYYLFAYKIIKYHVLRPPQKGLNYLYFVQRASFIECTPFSGIPSSSHNNNNNINSNKEVLETGAIDVFALDNFLKPIVYLSLILFTASNYATNKAISLNTVRSPVSRSVSV